jgi:hypothetical protein
MLGVLLQAIGERMMKCDWCGSEGDDVQLVNYDLDLPTVPLCQVCRWKVVMEK